MGRKIVQDLKNGKSTSVWSGTERRRLEWEINFESRQAKIQREGKVATNRERRQRISAL